MRCRSRRRWRAKPLTRILILGLVLGLFISFCESRVAALPPGVFEVSAKAFAQKQISNVVEESFSDVQQNYQIVYTDENRASVLDTDSAAIASLKTALAKDLNEHLSGGYTAYIPIGNLFYSQLLNGRGFKIPVRLYFNGSASVELKSELVSAGVNQSNFRLTAVVTAELSSNSLSNGGTVSFTENYLLCDTVLLGETPMINR